MKVSVFMTPTRALLYVKQEQDDGSITHLVTDEKFLLYHYLRKETPNTCVLFDTRKELEEKLAKLNYRI